MSTIRVQRARDADIPAIERLAVRTGPLHPQLDWATVISALGAFAAVDDDRIAGVMVLWPHPDHARIEAFMIDPAARGAGIGGALLDHAETTGGGSVRLLSAAVTPGVRAFAARRGYVLRDGVLEKRPA